MPEARSQIEGVEFSMNDLVRFRATLTGDDYLKTLGKVINAMFDENTEAASLSGSAISNDAIRESRGSCKTLKLLKLLPDAVDKAIGELEADIEAEKDLTP